MLRLLPKCKHAFHLECVDTWLGSHSTCPLCRNRVEADDVLIVEDFIIGGKCTSDEQQQQQQQMPARNSSAGGRLSSAGRNSNVELAGTDRALQLYVHRESDFLGSPSLNLLGRNTSRKESVSSSGSRRNEGNERKDSLLQVMDIDEQQLARRCGHRIFVSDAAFQHRWSDFMPSDVLFLSSQTLLGYTDLSVCKSVNSSGRLPEPDPSHLSTFSPRKDLPLESGSCSEAIDPARPSTSSSSVISSSKLHGTHSPSRNAAQQGPRHSCSSRSDLPSSSRIQEAILSRLSASRDPGKIGLLHSDGAAMVDLEIDSNSGKLTEVEAKGVFERQANLFKRPIALGRPDSGATQHMPSYQRSVSEVSGMRRYADSDKSPALTNNSDEKTTRWFSIARNTLNWLTGGGKGRPFHEGDYKAGEQAT